MNAIMTPIHPSFSWDLDMVDAKVELADLVDVGTEVEGCNDQPSVRLEMYSSAKHQPSHI